MKKNVIRDINQARVSNFFDEIHAQTHIQILLPSIYVYI